MRGMDYAVTEAHIEKINELESKLKIATTALERIRDYEVEGYNYDTGVCDCKLIADNALGKEEMMRDFAEEVDRINRAELGVADIKASLKATTAVVDAARVAGKECIGVDANGLWLVPDRAFWSLLDALAALDKED